MNPRSLGSIAPGMPAACIIIFLLVTFVPIRCMPGLRQGVPAFQSLYFLACYPISKFSQGIPLAPSAPAALASLLFVKHTDVRPPQALSVCSLYVGSTSPPPLHPLPQMSTWLVPLPPSGLYPRIIVRPT